MTNDALKYHIMVYFVGEVTTKVRVLIVKSWKRSKNTVYNINTKINDGFNGFLSGKFDAIINTKELGKKSITCSPQ